MPLRRRLRPGAALLALAVVAFTGCSGLIADGSNETLPPLVPGNTAPLNTQAPAVGPDGNPVVNTQGPTTTAAAAQDPGPVEADDADPTSVAARFLAAVQGDDADTASDLEMPDRRPTVYEWARTALRQYTQVAGASAWGTPTCGEPRAATVHCSWLQTDAAPTLQLVQDGTRWRVSHPVFTRPGEPAPAGSGCIIGSDNVNFRGGPGTNWPRFASLSPGNCSVTVFDAVESDPIEGDEWRLVEFEGRRGWVVDRVVDM